MSSDKKALIVLLCGFALVTVSFGVRASFGVYLTPLSLEFGISIATLSTVFAVQNLIWGATQPIAGGFADRYGAMPVAIAGALIYASGLGLMLVDTGILIFGLGAGVVIGCAQAALGFPVLLAAIGRTASPARRSLFMGIGTAGGSFGQFLFAPMGQMFLEQFGLIDSLLLMTIICLGAASLALGVRFDRGAAGTDGASSEPRMTIIQALRQAGNDKGFLLLNAGFFVCGFHVAFIGVHLPTFATVCGLPASVGVTGLMLIGLFNIIGSIGAGQLGGKYRPKFPLSLIYLLRGVAAMMLLIVPVTEFVLLAFSVAMGLLWLSTVPLTSMIVARLFGPAHAGMLFGIVFLCHQIGSFVGLTMAGHFYETTGNYDIVWMCSVALGVFAFLVHLPIDDRIKEQPATA